MTHFSALPFTLSRSESAMGGTDYVSTRERVHGLLRLDPDRVVIQWRVSRATESMGLEWRTDREVEPVREATVPLTGLAAARVRWIWWRWPPGPYLELTGADLRAFEEVAGDRGLRLDHPAKLLLRLRRVDLPGARDFAGELELAVADQALRAAEGLPGLPLRDEEPT